MVGTDSTFVGAKPSPRTYGSFPRILGEFVREKRIMGLEDAVRFAVVTLVPGPAPASHRVCPPPRSMASFAAMSLTKIVLVVT
jgi:hypothetical protein